MLSLFSKLSRKSINTLRNRNFSNSKEKKLPPINPTHLLISGSMMFGGAYYLKTMTDKKDKILKDLSIKEVKENYSTEINKITIINNETALCELNDSKKIILNVPDGKYLEDKLEIDVPIYYQNAIGFSQILPTMATLGLVGMMFWIMKRQMGGMKNLMGSNANVSVLENVKTKFSDIVGQENAKQGVKEFVDILKNKDKYSDIGVKVPKGALLSGPPGTGKTLLAKAIAGESKLPFVNMSGSDFNAMFVGVGSAKVKNLYQQASEAAKEHGGCIVFIDEIDAIGQKRSSANTFGGNTERENTLNQLLTEMDGFDSNENVMTFAATNRPELLDPALLRPGRFDRKINVELPTITDRKSLFDFYLNKLNISNDVIKNIGEIGSKLTPGFSGADIANICNESGIIAVRNKKDSISDKDVKDAIDYVMLGAERSNVLTEKEKITVAYHEAGHALLSCLLPNVTKPVKVSIIPREKGMLGFSQSEASSEVLQTKKQILDTICVLMGGRISEEIFCEDITTGAANDIEKVTQLANAYIKKFGMEEEIFMDLTEKSQFKSDVSQELRNNMDAKVLNLIESLYSKTKQILLNNEDQIEKIKNELLEKETIYNNDLMLILKQ